MVIIILTVYKSCTKNRENDLLRHELGSYAHIIESTDSNTTSNLFPPPPPPYGYDNASNNPTGSIPNEATESHSAQQQPQSCVYKPEIASNIQNNGQSNSESNPSNTWGNFPTAAAISSMASVFVNRRR